MGTRKTKKVTVASDSPNSDAIKNILEALITETATSVQHDAFYAAKVRALQEIDHNFFPAFAKFFLKATLREQELLLPLLRHVQGLEHIKFLQDFVRRAPFLPRVGMIILELFNKSDAMLEAGVASKLLDLDSLARRIAHSLLQGTVDTTLIEELLKLSDHEQEGLLTQLREETGVRCTLLIAAAMNINPQRALHLLNTITRQSDELSLQILTEVFNKTGSKDVAKTLKKMAHCLRQKGVAVDFPMPEKQPRAVFQQAVLPEPRAFISMVDADGTRIIFLIKPVSIYETKIFNVLMSDRRGIHDIEVITALRRDTRKFINRLLADTKVEFLETDISAAMFLVEEACMITQDQVGIIPSTIAQLRTAFAENSGVRNTPLVYDYIRQDAIDHARNTTSIETLIEATQSNVWFAVTPEARDAWLKLAAILHSPLDLSEEQKKSRYDDVVKETALQFFTPERCQQFKRRLEETALFLHQKKGAELAAAVLAAAQDLCVPAILPAEHEFCCEVIRKGFALFEKAYMQSTTGSPSGQPSQSGGNLLSA